MAKKQSKKTTPKSDLNVVPLVKKFKPFRNPDDGKEYIVIEEKDDKGQVVGSFDLPLEDETAQLIVLAEVANQFVRFMQWPQEHDTAYANKALKAEALRNQARKPNVPEAYQQIQSKDKEKKAEAKHIYQMEEALDRLDVVVRGKEVVIVLPDNSTVNARSEAAKAVVFAFLSRQFERDATDTEIKNYLRVRMNEAIKDAAGDLEEGELFMEEYPIEAAIVMQLLVHDEVEGSETELRELLWETAAYYGFPAKEWPAGKGPFGKYLQKAETLILLARVNVEVEYSRKGRRRVYKFSWIEPSNIPEWAYELAEDVKKAKDEGQEDEGQEEEEKEEEGLLA